MLLKLELLPMLKVKLLLVRVLLKGTIIHPMSNFRLLQPNNNHSSQQVLSYPHLQPT